MKFNYLIIPLLLLLSLSLSAQVDERNALKASFGISGHAQEKVNTPTLLLAFNKDFYPRTLIEINAAWLMPVDVSTEEEMRELQSFRFGMNFLFKALDERKQIFHVGLGFSAGLYFTERLSIANLEKNTDGEFLPGFSAVAEYNYILPSQWFFGGRASASRFDSDRNTWFLGGVLGYRF